MDKSLITTIVSSLVIPILLELFKEYRSKSKLAENKEIIQSVSQQPVPSDVQFFYTLLQLLAKVFVIAIGAFSTAFALKSFLIPNELFPGGITGICLLVHEYYHVNIAFLLLAFNLPFIVFGYIKINYKYALKSLISVFLLSVFVLFVPFPVVTSDKLLIAVFGGFFLGVGMGISIRNGCTADGIDALILSKWKRITLIENILNIGLFSFITYTYGIGTALYSLLTYVANYQLTNYFLTYRASKRFIRMKWLNANKN